MDAISRVWYNCSYAIAAKPIKTLEFHNTMIQLLIISDIPQFKLGNIRPRNAFRPIARERKYLMDYYESYNSVLWGDNDSGVFTVRYQDECTSKRSCRRKIKVSNQFCMHLRYIKQRETKFQVLFYRVRLPAFKISEHIQPSKQAKTKPKRWNSVFYMLWCGLHVSVY